jgi:hypothetical protein
MTVGELPVGPCPTMDPEDKVMKEVAAMTDCNSDGPLTTVVAAPLVYRQPDFS